MDGLVQRCGEWWDDVGEDVFLYRDRASFSNKRICARRYRMLTFKLRSAEMTSMRMRVSYSLIWDRNTVIFTSATVSCCGIGSVTSSSTAPTKLPHTTARLLSAPPSMIALRKLEKHPSAREREIDQVRHRRLEEVDARGGSGVGRGGSGRSGQMERTTLGVGEVQICTVSPASRTASAWP